MPDTPEHETLTVWLDSNFALDEDALKDIVLERFTDSLRKESTHPLKILPYRAVEPTTVEARKFKDNLERTMDILRESFEETMRKPLGNLQVEEIEVALE